MNDKIIRFLSDKMQQKNVDYVWAAQKAGLSVKHIKRVFEYGDILYGSEFLYLCHVLEIDQSELMGLVKNSF